MRKDAVASCGAAQLAAQLGVQVVVVSYNTREHTLRCIHALRASSLEKLELCLVDNASSDGSAEAVRKADPHAQVYSLERNVGFGAANNLGVVKSRTPFVALVNSDAFVGEHTLRLMRDYLHAHPHVGVVGPRLLNADGSRQACWFHFPSPARAWMENLGILGLVQRMGRLWGAPEKPGPGPVDWVSGACLMVRRDVWRASGGFDEQFFLYSEETDWQRRVRDLGWEIHGVAGAVAVHLGGASGAAFAAGARAFFWEGVDRYFRAHYGLPGVLSLRTATVVGAFLRAAGCAGAGDLRKASRWWAIVRSQCTRPWPKGGRRWSAAATECFGGEEGRCSGRG